MLSKGLGIEDVPKFLALTQSTDQSTLMQYLRVFKDTYNEGKFTAGYTSSFLRFCVSKYPQCYDFHISLLNFNLEVIKSGKYTMRFVRNALNDFLETFKHFASVYEPFSLLIPFVEASDTLLHEKMLRFIIPVVQRILVVSEHHKFFTQVFEAGFSHDVKLVFKYQLEVFGLELDIDIETAAKGDVILWDDGEIVQLINKSLSDFQSFRKLKIHIPHCSRAARSYYSFVNQNFDFLNCFQSFVSTRSFSSLCNFFKFFEFNDVPITAVQEYNLKSLNRVNKASPRMIVLVKHINSIVLSFDMKKKEIVKEFYLHLLSNAESLKKDDRADLICRYVEISVHCGENITIDDITSILHECSVDVTPQLAAFIVEYGMNRRLLNIFGTFLEYAPFLTSKQFLFLAFRGRELGMFTNHNVLHASMRRILSIHLYNDFYHGLLLTVAFCELLQTHGGTDINVCSVLIEKIRDFYSQSAVEKRILVLYSVTLFLLFRFSAEYDYPLSEAEFKLMQSKHLNLNLNIMASFFLLDNNQFLNYIHEDYIETVLKLLLELSNE
ncbi:hypothetical protein PCE1_000092 [Barthelona sp. PCE]